MRKRDWAYEALAAETASDPEIARGELNAALRDIRKMEPEVAAIEDSYLLADLICARAKMYRIVFDGAALTPTALAKHWLRVLEEHSKLKRGGSNLHVGNSKPFPPPAQERNLAEARKLMEKMGWR